MSLNINPIYEPNPNPNPNPNPKYKTYYLLIWNETKSFFTSKVY